MASPSDPSLEQLVGLLEQLALARRGGSPDDALESALARQRAACLRSWDCPCQLAVYGTLAPGRPNHHVLADLRGSWRPGQVHGHLRHGRYPMLRWDPTGPPVDVLLFTSTDLPLHWQRIDAFEGDDYRRILVPVLADGELLAVANCYEAATAG